MTESTRCPLCSAPHEACGPTGTGPTPVDIIHNLDERRPDVASDSEARWVNMATRDGREQWALLNLRRSDPQWDGSLPKAARKSPRGGPVKRELVSNKARTTEPGTKPVRAPAKTTAAKVDPAGTDPASTEPAA